MTMTVTDVYKLIYTHGLLSFTKDTWIYTWIHRISHKYFTVGNWRQIGIITTSSWGQTLHTCMSRIAHAYQFTYLHAQHPVINPCQAKPNPSCQYLSSGQRHTWHPYTPGITIEKRPILRLFFNLWLLLHQCAQFLSTILLWICTQYLSVSGTSLCLCTYSSGWPSCLKRL